MNVGNVVINRKARSISIKGHETFLSIPEFELLFFFAQNPDKVITLKNLLHNIWGSDTFLYDSSVETYINKLCKRIGKNLIQKLGNDRYMLHFDKWSVNLQLFKDVGHVAIVFEPRTNLRATNQSETFYRKRIHHRLDFNTTVQLNQYVVIFHNWFWLLKIGFIHNNVSHLMLHFG